MKKGRIGSILLTLAMLLQFIPAYANAAEPRSLGGVMRAEDSEKVFVETKAGVNEDVEVVTEEHSGTDGVKIVSQSAEGFVTDSGMIVDYGSEKTIQPDGLYEFEDHYSVQDAPDLYEAEGGSDRSNEYHTPTTEIGINITEDDINASNKTKGNPVGVIETTGDVKESEDDGVYDYFTVERITQSVVTLVTKSLEITDAHGDVNPDDMDYVHSEIIASSEVDMIDRIGKNSSNLEPLSRLDRENHGGGRVR